MYGVIDTGSAWTEGFEGNVDDLRIELTNGNVYVVDLEKFMNSGEIISPEEDAAVYGEVELIATYDDGDDDNPVPGWMVDASALTPETQLEIVEQQKLLGQLINGLPPDKQDVFRMVYDDEMDLHSVADALQIPEGTVKSRLYHGRKQIAEQLNGLSEQ